MLPRQYAHHGRGGAVDADAPAAAGTRAVGASGEYKPAAETAVDRLKRRLAWRSDAEEAALEKLRGLLPSACKGLWAP